MSSDQVTPTSRWSKVAVPALLAATIVAGGALRLFNVDWDQGYLFHPDERMILMTIGGMSLPWPPDPALLLTPASPLNPHFFAYGSLPLYLLKAAAHLLAQFQPALSDFEHIRLIGRTLSGLFDTALIALVFLLGVRLYDRRTGLLAAVFVAFTVLHIQLSHFYTVDTLLTFFIVLAMLSGLGIVRSGSMRSTLATGACLGLALATKVSVAPLALTVGVAWMLWAAGPNTGGHRRPWIRAMAGVMLAGLVSLAVFLIGEPYALIDWQSFIRRIGEESNMVRGISDLPYTRQYIGTPAYLYQVWNTVVWGMGVPLGVVAFGGLLTVFIRGLLRRRAEDILLLSWVLVYFLINGSFMVKFLRYMLPIVPFLCIMGANAVFVLADGLRQSRPRWSRYLLPFLAVLVILPTVFYAVAFVNVYAQPHPWIQVSEWMYRNLPANSVIATEHWDDRLPLGMTVDKVRRAAESYGHKDMANYEEDNAAKLSWIVDNLQTSNVIVLATNRLYGSIARLPDRYPLTTAYYQMLFSEKLGFRLASFAATYPSLLGVTLEDDTFADPGLPAPAMLTDYQPSPIVLNLGKADESFTVYDHPKPLVFVKTSQMTAEELRALFEPAMLRVDEQRQQRLAREAAARAPQTGGVSGKTLLLSDQDRAIQEAGGTFAEMFDPASVGNRMPVAFWWLVIFVLGWLAFPVSFGLLRTFDDRGLFFAKALGILLLGYVVWLAASLRLLPYTQTTIWLAMAGFVGVSGGLYWRQRREIGQYLRQHRNLVFAAEGAFLCAYLVFCIVRELNPDLWQPWLGGEKPMEFAFLNAIVRSTYFPPYDPYFAGGTINYYYYGQYLVATLSKLSGILPSVAFNTAVPSLFALTFCGAVGVVYNLTGRDAAIAATATGRRRLGFGLVAGLFVTVLGNLNGMVQVMDGLSKNSTVAMKSALPGLEGLARLVTGAAASITQRLPLSPFDYWRSTRLVPNTINEFPYFSFLFADLHAHMIGLPFTVLVLALALNLARERRDSGNESTLVASLLRVLVIAVCVGALAATNSWDLPTYLGIILCALVIRDWAAERRVRVVQTLARFGLIAVLSILLYLPFFQNYQALYLGLDVSSFKTSLADYWQIFGFFLFLVVTFLAVETAAGDSQRARLLRLAIRRWDRLPRLRRLLADLSEPAAAEEGGLDAPPPARPAPWGLWVTGWTAVVSLILALAGLHLMAVLVPLVVLSAALTLRRGQSSDQLFTLLLIFTAALISLGVEVVYLRDFLGGGDYQRMNTLFKFYMQVWVFYGIAAAVALARLTQQVPTMARPGPALTSTWVKGAWWAVFAVLLLAVMIYPVAGTAARVNDRFPGARPEIGTMDGMAFMTVGSYTWDNRTIDLKYDYDAIQWLLWNVRGSPVVAEAAIGYYREFGVRVASFTGLPTLLGMHQSEQRYDFQVGARDGEARTFFTESDYARVFDLAKRLHIKYVYVGQLERIVYPAAGLAKFDRAVGTYLDVVYENPRTKIYAVR